MDKLRHCVRLFILAGFIGAAFGQPAQASAAPNPESAPDRRWQDTLAKAKEEGRVSVYALWKAETRNALTKAVKEKYAINVEFTPFNRGSELLAKVQAENRAGLYFTDVIGAGAPTLVATMKPKGVLAPMESSLILPEVTDAKSWSGGVFPFVDKGKYAVGMLAGINRYIMYNTSLIKKGEITTYKDVLKPRYKGKITLNDPTVTGIGNAFMSFLAVDLLNLEEAKDFLQQLVVQQQVVIQRDNRLHVESVARGKFAIGLAPTLIILPEFIDAGAPIEVAYMKEGTFVSPGAAAMGVPTKFAHPNAAKVFINWLLSKEGQTVFSRSFGVPSLRTDVSTEGINRIFLPQPGEKLFLQSEESIFFQGKMLTIAKEVIEKALK